MMHEIKAPNPYNCLEDERALVFLAGSIEMGEAEQWQRKLCDDYLMNFNITVLNPRRDDWEPAWNDDDHHPSLVEQIQWELQAMEDADLIIMYFSPETKSPITLLELGLYCGRQPEKLLVCCPPGYWRRSNVLLTCDRYGVKMVHSLSELGRMAHERLAD